MSGSPKPPTALTVLGGFLGAGKTTYLNRLLASELAEGVGIVVNDFGAICIDEQLVVCREDRLISLANGCVCCDLGENLVDALSPAFGSILPNYTPSSWKRAELPIRPVLAELHASEVTLSSTQ